MMRLLASALRPTLSPSKQARTGRSPYALITSRPAPRGGEQGTVLAPFNPRAQPPRGATLSLGLSREARQPPGPARTARAPTVPNADTISRSAARRDGASACACGEGGWHSHTSWVGTSYLACSRAREREREPPWPATISLDDLKLGPTPPPAPVYCLATVLGPPSNPAGIR